MKPEIRTLKVFIELSDHSWIEKIRDADGKQLTSGGGQEKLFDEVWLDIALNNLGEAMLEW